MDLFEIYHPDIPDFISALSQTPEMLRLRGIGMDCGCEYTSFPVFANRPAASRYEHSIGVALIVWHFTGSRAQSVAGLLHDISTPVFAHTVDFMNRDYIQQESTESGTREMISRSGEIQRLLSKYGLSTEEVCDYHRYPIADNDAPGLSADRLEYTLRNLIRYVGKTPAAVQKYYEDLTVAKNEQGHEELAFCRIDIAENFVLDALAAGKIYLLDEDRYSMEALAGLLRSALQRSVLSLADLHTTESRVIHKLLCDPVSAADWTAYRALSRMLRADTAPAEPGWIRIPAKKRYIDPLVLKPSCGRISALSPDAFAEMEAFQAIPFDYWIKGIAETA